jgi:GAF domain-containing protein
MASSSETAHLLGLFELQNDEGPCLDAFQSGLPVLNQPLAGASPWPSFGSQAREAGFVMAHAFPLRLRDRVIGALNLLHTEVVELGPGEAQLAQAMADVATVGILQERALTEARVLAEQLQTALNSRIVIEQAKGFVAQRLTVGVDRAFDMLRSYARSHNRRLAEVARAVIAGELRAETLQQP